MNQLLQTLTRCPKVVVFLFLFAVSLILMAGCDRGGPKGETRSGFFGARVDTITVRDTIVVVDTMLVEKEIILRDTILVEKEVIKKVEVPAEIPAHYENVWKRLVAELAAPIADEKTCFSGLNSMEVRVVMNENAKDILSEQRAKDRFELTLRRHGVPLSDFSNPYILLGVDAIWNNDKIIAAYIISVSLIEPLIFYRNQKPYKRFVTLWEQSNYGLAGKMIAKETFLESIEEKAERVANLYLSAN